MGRPKYDYINPSHYNTHPSGVECIDVCENLNFCQGNAFKYLWRMGDKPDQPVERDAEKAIWYLERDFINVRNITMETFIIVKSILLKVITHEDDKKGEILMGFINYINPSYNEKTKQFMLMSLKSDLKDFVV